MRIYSNCYELMSELGRNLWEMGDVVKPKTYQNKVIENQEGFATKELICEQYCLTKLDREEYLFIHDPRSIEWTQAEFQERVIKPTHGVNKIHYLNPGEAYKIRKDLWEDFLVLHKKFTSFKELEDGGEATELIFDYSYNERIMHMSHKSGRGYMLPNLTLVIELLKKDNDTRKAVLPIFTIEDVANNNGSKRIPCSMYYDFLIRERNGTPYLNICYHQRSADLVSHFGNDVYLAWKLMEYVAEQVNVKPGYLYHTIDSLHAYSKDWSKLKASINEL